MNKWDDADEDVHVNKNLYEVISVSRFALAKVLDDSKDAKMQHRHTSKHNDAYTRTRTHTHAHALSHTHTHTHTQARTHMEAHTHTHTHTHTCTHTLTHTNTHTHTHNTHIHTNPHTAHARTHTYSRARAHAHTHTNSYSGCLKMRPTHKLNVHITNLPWCITQTNVPVTHMVVTKLSKKSVWWLYSHICTCLYACVPVCVRACAFARMSVCERETACVYMGVRERVFLCVRTLVLATCTVVTRPL